MSHCQFYILDVANVNGMKLGLMILYNWLIEIDTSQSDWYFISPDFSGSSRCHQKLALVVSCSYTSFPSSLSVYLVQLSRCCCGSVPVASKMCGVRIKSVSVRWLWVWHPTAWFILRSCQMQSAIAGTRFELRSNSVLASIEGRFDNNPQLVTMTAKKQPAACDRFFASLHHYSSFKFRKRYRMFWGKMCRTSPYFTGQLW